MTQVSQKPVYNVFIVDDKHQDESKEPFWLKVGAAFPHKDGKGLNIVLQALPVGNNRLVLRSFQESAQ